MNGPKTTNQNPNKTKKIIRSGKEGCGVQRVNGGVC